MIDLQMPLWFQILQIIGWCEIITLYILVPFERKYKYLEKFQQYHPKNPWLGILFTVSLGFPVMCAGIFACLSYLPFMFLLWLFTK